MNTYEKCKLIRQIIINRAAEVIAYKNWNNKFATEQIRDLPEELSKNDKCTDLFNLDPTDLTKKQMKDLGFIQWNEKNPIMLIPLWLFSFLKDEFNSDCIDEKKKLIKKSEMNLDNRGGCLAYGVMPKLY